MRMGGFKWHASTNPAPSQNPNGQLVEITIEESNVSMAEIMATDGYQGADGSDPVAFKAWLQSRGVSASKADAISKAPDVHAAMRSHIRGQ